MEQQKPQRRSLHTGGVNLDDNNITSTNFDYDIYSGGSAEAAINEMYAEEQKELERARKLAAKSKKNKLDFTGVESVTDENIDSLIYGSDYVPEPEPVEMADPIVPAHNDLRDRAMTNRNSEPSEYVNPYTAQPAPTAGQGMQAQQNMQQSPVQGQRPSMQQQAPQQSVPAYQVGANDPYATDNFNSTYTDTSNYQAEAMAARMRGQTVTYGQAMYGGAPQPMFDPQTGQPLQQPQQNYSPYDAQGRYDPLNVYGQNGQYQPQQGRMSQAEGIAMVDQMLAQGRRDRSSLYESIPSHQKSSTYRSTTTVRPGMSKRERGVAQVESMMAQDRASHGNTDSFIKALNASPMELGARRSGHSYGTYDMFGRREYNENDEVISGELAWYLLWFAAGAGIPFGAFDLNLAFCIMIGSVFGLIGAVIKHNGKEGFDFKTSILMSKTEIALIPICIVLGIVLYFYI